MDDPWGSPWADESPHPSPKLDKPVSKQPVTTEKVSVAGQNSKSPWDDNDGFGEWTTLPGTDGVQANEQDGPEQAEIAEWDASVEKEFTQEKDHVRPDGSSWFSRQMQHMDGVSLGLEISQVNGRASSPDPWAQEVPRAVERAQFHHAPEPNNGDELRIGDTDGDGTHNRLANTEIRDEDGTPANDELNKAAPAIGDGKESIGELSMHHDQDEPTASLENTTADVHAREVMRGESLASRPSSSPSDHSHHDDVLTESPRTSFEEEDKKPRLEREGSSKVKDMVRLFDSLAPGEDSTALTGHVDANDDRIDTPLAAQSEDDYGDFEEGISSITDKADLGDHIPVEQGEKFRDATIIHRISDVPASAKETNISPSEQPLGPHAQLQFEPDPLLLSHIFGQMADAEYVHADPKKAPEFDTVMKDSFSSTNQRKTWYRISRFGTMRKHNAGNEDSYVRINWKDSDVRAETLKVVERWIEEDRLGGGVILGGGTRLGSMFGWGQKNTSPMSVAAALASRTGKTGMHSDHDASPTSTWNSETSPIHTSTSSRKSLERVSASRNSFQSPASATAPQFSWSTGPPPSATAEVMLPILPPMMSPKGHFKASDNASSKPKFGQEFTSRDLPMSKVPLAASKSVSAQPAGPADEFQKLGGNSVIQMAPEPTTGRRRSGDEDWGEMVSSPALENPPPLNIGFNTPINSAIVEVSSRCLGLTSENRSDDRLTALQSGSGALIAAGVENHAIRPILTPSTAPKSDGWTTADFSFFDSPAPSKSSPAPRAIAPKASIPKPVPLMQSQGPSKEQRVQAEQDRIVKGIVQNLPNLSYMLRR